MSIVPANPAQSMALAFMQALWAGDVETTDRLFAPDARWVFQYGMPQAQGSDGRVWPARDALARVIADLFGKFDPAGFVVTPTSLIGDGDLVAIEYQARGRTSRGLEYHNTYVTVLSIAGDHVLEIRPYNDTAHMLAMLGGDEERTA